GGAQAFLGVRSDLSLFSKAMANGMPISAVTGRRDVMSLLEKDVFFFTTFGGEALSLAASIACIRHLRDHGVIERIALRGQSLLDGLQRIIGTLGLDYVSVTGYPFRTLVSFDTPAGDTRAGDPLVLKTLVQQELIRRGVLWAGIHNLCDAHAPEDIDYTLAAYGEALGVLKEAVDAGRVSESLEGAPIEPVFRKIGGFHTKARAEARDR
ncbi:MAG: aminotransferase class III-fold pyridoxal phosphate-dependent enzyme, partial [Actinomycetota bacterium]